MLSPLDLSASEQALADWRQAAEALKHEAQAVYDEASAYFDARSERLSENFSHCRSEIKQPPCGNETQGDRREKAYSA